MFRTFLCFCCTFVLLIRTFPGFSQECTGYVLYKQTFEGNAGLPASGNALPAGVTNNQFTSSGNIDDGHYGIRKKTGPMFNWLVGPDHTGNGYMMVINADYQAGKFYETRIDGLCQGSTFYFSAWIANLLPRGSNNPLDPNISFKIRRVSDNSLINSIETGDLERFSSLTWKQYGIRFKLPTGESSVILQIFNNQVGGSGNDLALDDIEFSLCGPPINITRIGTYQNSEDVCLGQAVSFKASVETSGYSLPVLQWQFSRDSAQWTDIPGATQLKYDILAAQPSDSGWYRLLVAEQGNLNSPNCHISSKEIPLFVWSPRSFDIESNSPVCEGSPLRLSAPPALSYDWKGPNGFSSDQPALVFNEATRDRQGAYQLTRITRGGCISNAGKGIVVQPNELKVSLGNDTVICEGTAIDLNVYNAMASYEWNTGAQNPEINVRDSGTFSVVVRQGVCSRSDSIHIGQLLLPKVELGSDTIICAGEPFVLNAFFPGTEKYEWQDGSDSASYIVTNSSLYSVTLSNRCGVAADGIRVKVEKCADHLLFPTAFSPNHDGQNDLFHPRILFGISHYQLRIFNRWGQLVFHSSDPTKGWNGVLNGKSVPMGGYVWMAKYIRTRDQHPISQDGTIMLIR